MLKIRGAKLRLMHLCDRVLSLQCFFFFFFFFIFLECGSFGKKTFLPQNKKTLQNVIDFALPVNGHIEKK